MIINTIFYNVKLCVKLSGAMLPDLYSYMGTNITEQRYPLYETSTCALPIAV